MAREAREVLRKIAISHLENKYGKIDIQKKGAKEFWKFDGKTVKPYFFADHDSMQFINGFPRTVLKSMVDQNVFYMGIHYCGRCGNQFKAYCLQPEVILKNYIRTVKKGTKRCHIRIKLKDDNKHLVLSRSGKFSDIDIPVDDKNYCICLEMTDKEYGLLEPLIPKKKRRFKPKKALKVIVKDKKGSKEFSTTSAKVIAILSVLFKSKKPLTTEEILDGIICYGISQKEKKEINSIKRDLKKLLDTGGIIVSEESTYKISDNIQVEVAL